MYKRPFKKVLTPLPRRGFQVFKVAGREEERENGECIDHLFRSIIYHSSNALTDEPEYVIGVLISRDDVCQQLCRSSL